MFGLFKILVSASVVAATFQNVTTSLNIVNNQTIFLTKQLQAYNGSQQQLNNAQYAYAYLVEDIQSATANLSNVNLTSPQASQLIRFISRTLIPNIRKDLSVWVAKNSTFVANDATTYPQVDLLFLLSYTNQFDATLVSKVPAPQKTAASRISSVVSSMYTSATNVYYTRGS